MAIAVVLMKKRNQRLKTVASVRQRSDYVLKSFQVELNRWDVHSVKTRQRSSEAPALRYTTKNMPPSQCHSPSDGP
jgi:hypothetical protein